MPEDKENPAAGAGTDDAGAGEGQNGDDQNKNTATDTGNEDAGAGEGTENKDGDGAGDKDTSKGQEANKDAKAPKEGSQKDDDVDDGQEPPSRKRLSKQDFIIGRQRKKLSKAAKAEGEGEGEGKGNNDTDEDDEIAPEDEEMITKVVAKKFAPIIDKSLADDDDKEVNNFLKENPDFKPFEAKARRYMQHPSRRALPIEAIFFEVAGRKLLQIGANRAKEADKKAKDTQTGGGSNRGGEGSKGVWDLPKDDFEAKQERIRHGQ